MIKFSRDKVLLLHQLISEATGGDPELRDMGLLESALESAEEVARAGLAVASGEMTYEQLLQWIYDNQS